MFWLFSGFSRETLIFVVFLVLQTGEEEETEREQGQTRKPQKLEHQKRMKKKDSGNA